ncbi:hypothetical protein NLU13_6706 [Sarocladium strictum]|uniref:NAD(P)-binding protein n=1 Tax=Sarocladium strictum TaxID=5046 RepID=A0AA39GEF5_SARSR|nr:hypothetical protein NLU13_6706 [Sarocladium strictum]
MASYVVVGASRGLGFEFLRQLSANPSNIIIGLVRDVESTKAKVDAEIGRSNIHLLRYDLDDPSTVSDVVSETSALLGGKLDHLIANAGIGGDHYMSTLTELAKEPELLQRVFNQTFRTNVVGNAQIIGSFMPLILLGRAKKVIVLSSGMGDTELTRQYDIWMGPAYSASKAALNMVVAKYSAEYREKGVVVLAISPGVVDTGMSSDPQTAEPFKQLGAKLVEYAPTFKGPITPEESVGRMLALVEKSKPTDSNMGDMISHLGTKQWVGDLAE